MMKSLVVEAQSPATSKKATTWSYAWFVIAHTTTFMTLPISMPRSSQQRTLSWYWDTNRCVFLICLTKNSMPICKKPSQVSSRSWQNSSRVSSTPHLAVIFTKTVAHAVGIVLRAGAAASVHRALAFEVPSGTDQALPGLGDTFAPTVFVDIDSQLDRKINAMRAYSREMRAFPHPRSLEMLTAKARSRGAQVGLAAAEAFILLREIV
jgi:hypothetical protein